MTTKATTMTTKRTVTKLLTALLPYLHCATHAYVFSVHMADRALYVSVEPTHMYQKLVTGALMLNKFIFE